ncbi:MAG: hypothetical protein ACFFCI_08505 [Promethearchaeota archaeon]
MTQIIVEEDSIFELKALHEILKEKIAEYQEKKKFDEDKKNIDLFLCFNPRYFESLITLKQAKLRIDTSDIQLSSKYNMFSAM